MTTNEESSLPAHPASQTGVDTSPVAWRTLIEAIEDGVFVQSLDRQNDLFFNGHQIALCSGV